MPSDFDPNAAASADSGIFGLPCGLQDSAIAFLPVPWEVTTSYGGGTAGGPRAIREASRQVDLFDADVLRPYEAGLFLLEEPAGLRRENARFRKLAVRIIARGGRIGGDRRLRDALEKINAGCARMNDLVTAHTRQLLQDGKIPAIIGGDHSVPFGAIRAAAEKHPAFGILHFDAHSDTRQAYEGFEWSHASIMFNVLEHVGAAQKLVQVGIRDFCEAEFDYGRRRKDRVRVFTDAELACRKMKGVTWDRIARQIVAELPRKVWISFDIDALDPRLCPHTGTPVPGGLDFNEANHVLRVLAGSGRTIIGFDLCEVAPGPDGEWDANVGARLLYKLSAWTLASQGLAKINPLH